MNLRDIFARCRAALAPREKSVPLTYAEVVALAKAGGTKCDRMAYDLLGLVDCGNADVFVSLVHTTIKANWDDARRAAFLAPLVHDGVFLQTGRVVAVNTQPGADGLAPLQRAAKAYDSAYGRPWIDDMAMVVNAAHAAGEHKP